MKNVLLAMAAAMVLGGCVSSAPVKVPAKRVRSENLTTIRYCARPAKTFEIEGTNTRGIVLKDLTGVLLQYKVEHPRAEYEVYAELPNKLADTEKIMKAIQDAGIGLKHYWVPLAFGASKVPGPYGPGFIDIAP